MIGSTRGVRVLARAHPTDLRLGFAGLYGLVRGQLAADLRSGDTFLFVNARRPSAKVLLWEGAGLCIDAKQLAKGTFSVP